MSRSVLWKVGKALEGLGLIVVLVGVFNSISYGLEDRGLESMAIEFKGLAIGGGLFVVGYLLERASGGR